jgi:RNA polymerase sigma-70 factor, ECF subfamily
MNGLEVGAVALGHESAVLRLEAHRTELIGYCYRMLSSVFDAIGVSPKPGNN